MLSIFLLDRYHGVGGLAFTTQSGYSSVHGLVIIEILKPRTALVSKLPVIQASSMGATALQYWPILECSYNQRSILISCSIDQIYVILLSRYLCFAKCWWSNMWQHPVVARVTRFRWNPIFPLDLSSSPLSCGRQSVTGSSAIGFYGNDLAQLSQGTWASNGHWL